MGRCPELKSADFCDANMTVIETISHLRLKPLKQVVQLLHIGGRPARATRDPKRSKTVDASSTLEVRTSETGHGVRRRST